MHKIFCIMQLYLHYAISFVQASRFRPIGNEIEGLKSLAMHVNVKTCMLKSSYKSVQ